MILKGIVGLMGGCLLILGFLSWRMEFSIAWLGINSFGAILVGCVLIAALIWGKMIGTYAMIGGGILLLIGIGALLIDKGFTFAEYSFYYIWGGIGAAVGALLFYVGSEEVFESQQAAGAHARTSIVCAACDQYLGTASSFRSPCPRCGSNRYERE